MRKLNKIVLTSPVMGFWQPEVFCKEYDKYHGIISHQSLISDSEIFSRDNYTFDIHNADVDNRIIIWVDDDKTEVGITRGGREEMRKVGNYLRSLSLNWAIQRESRLDDPGLERLSIAHLNESKKDDKIVFPLPVLPITLPVRHGYTTLDHQVRTSWLPDDATAYARSEPVNGHFSVQFYTLR